MRQLKRAVASAVTLAAISTGALAVTSSPAAADTMWRCDEYNSRIFPDTGVCAELNYWYRPSGRGGKCRIHADKVLLWSFGNESNFERAPAVRIHSADLVSGGGSFLWSRDEVNVNKRDSGASLVRRTFDPRGTWKARRMTLYMSWRAYLGWPQPDRESNITITPPYRRSC